MQNSPHTQTPSDAGYGQPPVAKKPRLSKGCIVGIVAAALVLLLAVVIIVVAAGGLYWFSRRAPGVTSRGPAQPTTATSSARAGGDADGPAPTSAQTAAVAGGQSARWEQQEISWTVPQRWSKQSVDGRTFFWRSPGSSDAASLIVSVSPMDAGFPAEVSLNAFYQQAQTRKQSGEVNEVRWLNLDGVKGVLFREAAPEAGDDPQRLQWMAYRNYKGQTQLVNVILAASGKHFARHEDALYGILYTTSFSP